MEVNSFIAYDESDGYAYPVRHYDGANGTALSVSGEPYVQIRLFDWGLSNWRSGTALSVLRVKQVD